MLALLDVKNRVAVPRNLRQVGRLVRAAFAASFLLPATLPNLVHAGDSYDLQSPRQTTELHRVTAKIEVTGNLKPSTDPKVPTLPLKVMGRFVYDEQRLDGNGTGFPRGSARYYREAQAEIHVDKRSETSTLRDSLRLIIARAEGKGETLIFSPHGPLTREELDLIDLQGNTLVADRLLPNVEVKIGDSWKISQTWLAPLLGLDAVATSSVEAKLAGVEGRQAQIEFAGPLNGAVAGVATEIDLSGGVVFDLQTKCLISIQLRIKERRSVGFVTPGFEVTADVTVDIAPLAGSDELTEAKLKELKDRESVALEREINYTVIGPYYKDRGPKSDPVEHDKLQAKAKEKQKATDAADQLLLFHSEAGNFHFVYDRRWRITRNEPSVAVMRLIDRGEMLAQCNVSALPQLSAGSSVTLEEFQDDIKKSLGQNFGAFETSEILSTATGAHLLKLTVSGKVANVPIQWRYYLLLDDAGRRIALCFTLDNSFVERFGDGDAIILGSLDFNQGAEAGGQGTKKEQK